MDRESCLPACNDLKLFIYCYLLVDRENCLMNVSMVNCLCEGFVADRFVISYEIALQQSTAAGSVLVLVLWDTVE